MSIDTRNTAANIRFLNFKDLDSGERGYQVLKTLYTGEKALQVKSSALFAEVDNKIVGFLSLGDRHFARKNTEYLDRIEVEPMHRRKSIGSALMLEAMRKAKAQGKKYFAVSMEEPLTPSEIAERNEEIKTLRADDIIFLEREKSFERDQQIIGEIKCFLENLIIRCGIDTKRNTLFYQRSDWTQIRFKLDTFND